MQRRRAEPTPITVKSVLTGALLFICMIGFSLGIEWWVFMTLYDFACGRSLRNLIVVSIGIGLIVWLTLRLLRWHFERRWQRSQNPGTNKRKDQRTSCDFGSGTGDWTLFRTQNGCYRYNGKDSPLSLSRELTTDHRPPTTVAKPLPAAEKVVLVCASCGLAVPENERYAIIHPIPCRECNSIRRRWERRPATWLDRLSAWAHLQRWQIRRRKFNL